MVGGFNPSEKYESVGIIIPNMWKNKKCSKPPTRFIYIYTYIYRSFSHLPGGKYPERPSPPGRRWPDSQGARLPQVAAPIDIWFCLKGDPIEISTIIYWLVVYLPL